LQRIGRRPSVDVDEPMVGLNLHVYQDQAVLSLDSSGESLHKRGYRPILTKAPLNEALAAALVLMTGWKGDTPFIDPLCGSGTLAIEAAWIAIRRPPGLTRKRFGFQGWMDFDIKLWTALRDEARRGVFKKLPAPIIGSDIRKDAIAFSRSNARAAGVGHLVRFEVKDVGDFNPPLGPPGVILCNPPYGERIGEEKELRVVYQILGDVFRTRCASWIAFVFTGNASLARQIGLRPAAKIPLFNGKIPCQLMRFDL
jgi:putative N6-adenine-specific DNA methylase